MPSVKCKCGAMTNSAVSEYWMRKNRIEDVAEGCYAKWVVDHWEEGCLFNVTASTDFMRIMATNMIKKGTNYGR